MGVISGISDRLIGHKQYFLESMEPTQGDNYVAITLAIAALQYSASLDSASVRQYVQTSMQFLGERFYDLNGEIKMF